VASLCAGGLGATEAVAVEPPSTERLEALQTVCGRAEGVRVLARRATYELHRPAVSAEGIALTRAQARDAVIEVGDVAQPVKLVAWSDIERVDVGDYHTGRATLAGLLLGAAAGVAIVAIYGSGISSDDDSGLIVFGAVLAAAGAGAGYLYGVTHPYWTPLYP